MTKRLDGTQAAKALRSDIRAAVRANALPIVKFSVRQSRGGTTPHLDINYVPKSGAPPPTAHKTWPGASAGYALAHFIEETLVAMAQRYVVDRSDYHADHHDCNFYFTVRQEQKRTVAKTGEAYRVTAPVKAYREAGTIGGCRIVYEEILLRPDDTIVALWTGDYLLCHETGRLIRVEASIRHLSRLAPRYGLSPRIDVHDMQRLETLPAVAFEPRPDTVFVTAPDGAIEAGESGDWIVPLNNA